MSAENIIYGLPGVGYPGKQGDTGPDGYKLDISANEVSDMNPVIQPVISLIGPDSSEIKFSNYQSIIKEFSLSSFSYNTYYAASNPTVPKYKFTYSIDINGSSNLDNLKIYAYLFFNNSAVYSYGSNNASYILLKNFYQPVTAVQTDITYSNTKPLTKVLVFAYEKIKGHLYKPLYLGEKTF